MWRVFPLSILIAGCGSYAEPGEGSIAVHADLGGAVREVIGERHIEVGAMASGVIVQQVESGAKYDLIIVGSKSFADRVTGGLERRVIARGRLAIYGVKKATLEELLSTDIRIAVANPKTAPYGVAAMTLLDSVGDATTRRAEIVQFDDVRAAKVAVDNGAAKVAIVSVTQAKLGPKQFVEIGEAFGVASTAIAFTAKGQEILRLLTSDQSQKVFTDAGLFPEKQR